MEAVGLLTGIVSLFPLCVAGYEMIVECAEADQTLKKEALRVYLQQGVRAMKSLPLPLLINIFLGLDIDPVG